MAEEGRLEGVKRKRGKEKDRKERKKKKNIDKKTDKGSINQFQSI